MSEYLENNLLPLILSIQPKKTESYICDCLDLGDRTSFQSFVISFGNLIEKFWNHVIDGSNAENLIQNSNMIFIEGKRRQMDHLFKVIDQLYYLETKCNLNLDSEKGPASNEKVNLIASQFDESIVYGYFVPVIRNESCLKTTPPKDVNVYGVEWMTEVIKTPFTSDEYFTFLKEVVGPIVVEKGF